MDYSQHDVSLKPFDPQRDLVILERWIRQPHIVHAWGDPGEVREQIHQHPPSQSAMIYAGVAPVGYLCWQVPTREELAEANLDGLPSDLVDIDLMIGDPHYLGQGVGPQALELLISQLSLEGAKTVGLATAISNERALKAFEKVGFTRYQQFIENGVEYYYLIRTIYSAA